MTLAETAQEAMDLQDACNLTGVAHAFSRSHNGRLGFSMHCQSTRQSQGKLKSSLSNYPPVYGQVRAGLPLNGQRVRPNN